MMAREARAFAKFHDGSVVDQSGRLLLVSVDRFVERILPGDNCFVCGEARGTRPFNDEHVIPDWILRKYRLHDQSITLPNRTRIRYAQYTVHCCTDCNREMGRVLEEPVCKVLAGGTHAVAEYAKANGPWLILSWMALLFFKTHYKDAFLSWNRDGRRPQHRIGEIYEWSGLHHVYCVARAFYSRAAFDSTALTSFLILPAKESPALPAFDYVDHYDSRGLMLRLGDTAIIAFLDDGCAALNLEKDQLRRLEGPLAAIQLRELFARMAYQRTLVESSCEYGSELSACSGRLTIRGTLPAQIETRDGNAEEFGSVMELYCTDILELTPEKQREEALARIRTGRASYLQDEQGRFMVVD
jgi:hypothetical protein